MKSTIHFDDICRKKMFLKNELASFFNRYPWEWFASLSLGGEQRPAHFAERNLKRWRTRMAIQFKIQIASMGVINHKPYTHIHLFMLGKNKYGDTLLSKNREIWERWWPEDAKIEVIHQQEGAIDYVIRKNMPDDQYELLLPYGLKHLKRIVGRSRYAPEKKLKNSV
jgi:hypothetical protein